MTRPCVVGPCRCGGWGIVLDADAEAELGVCHQEIPHSPPTPEQRVRHERALRLAETSPDPFCGWCYGEALEGRREDAGRPLTEEEAAVGFWACHAECRPLMDAMMAELASRGVFATVGRQP